MSFLCSTLVVLCVILNCTRRVSQHKKYWHSWEVPTSKLQVPFKKNWNVFPKTPGKQLICLPLWAKILCFCPATHSSSLCGKSQIAVTVIPKGGLHHAHEHVPHTLCDTDIVAVNTKFTNVLALLLSPATIGYVEKSLQHETRYVY